MHIAAATAGDAQRAELTYRWLTTQEIGPRRVDAQTTWLEVRPVTGRKHQFRVQLAAAGHAVLGDRKYGGRRTFGSGIALHARRLVVEHPVAKTPVEIEAPLPAVWRACGGGGANSPERY
jgi:23S rRNA pseudouridine1911/1915/1917 synthase